VLAFDWWDPDQQGRIQRVRFAIGDEWTEVLPPVPALAFHEDKPTFARVLLPIPKAACEAGFMRVAFEKVEGPDALLSEFWLLQREDAPPRKRVLIVTGDDYPGHLWRETSVELAEILREDPRLEVSINECPAILGSPLLSHYDAVVLHFKNYNDRLPLGEAVWSGLEQYVKDGGGLVLVHFGCGAFQEWPGFVEIAGRVWDPALRGHDPYGLFEVKIADETHAITGGMEAFQTEDELYTCLTGHTPIQVLCEATSKVDSKPYPMAFTVGETGGRVFHCTLGHDVNAFQAEGTRALYRRATAWAAGLEP
jgi:type 1 glutamine amidotransferase